MLLAVPFLAWWAYFIIVVIVFGICLTAHFVLKKINENRFEERFVRLYGKTSTSTQISSPGVHPEVPIKLERQFPKPEKVITTPRGISLIFSKEHNKGRTSLTTNWPSDETWKKNVITKKSLKLNSSSSLATKQSNTIQVFVSDNMSKSASFCPSASQDSSTSDQDAKNKIRNLDLNNVAGASRSKQDDQINDLKTNGPESDSISDALLIKYVGNNENTEVIKSEGQAFAKLLDVYHGINSGNNLMHPDKAQKLLINDSKENVLRNEIQLSATFSNNCRSSKEQASNRYVTEKPLAFIIAKQSMEKELVLEKNPEKNINFKSPVTILIPEKSQMNDTKSEHGSIKISTDTEDNKQNHENQDTSESRNLHDLSRSKESIKKSVSRVTFKHETMTPNIDDSRSSEASRSRTEFLKSSVTHSKESIMKSSVTHSKESIKKQPSRVTFVNGIKMPSSDSDSDIDTLMDSHFDITKITDSMTRLSEKTYSRESRLSDKIEENLLLHKKISSKVNFAEPVVICKANSKRGFDIKSRTSTAESLELSKSLLDQMVIYKSNLEQKMSELMRNEASTSSEKNDYKIFAQEVTVAIKPSEDLNIRRDPDNPSDTGTAHISIDTVCPNSSNDILETTIVRDPVSVHFAQDNTEIIQDSNLNKM